MNNSKITINLLSCRANKINQMKKLIILLFAGFTFLSGITSCSNQPPSEAAASTVIHINEVGFLPESTKTAMVIDADTDDFMIETTSGQEVFSGQLSEEKEWEDSGQRVRLADFSSVREAGNYVLKSGSAAPVNIVISPDAYTEIVKASAKYYYFNRASTSLEEQHAGLYQRPAAHPDTLSYIHSTAASNERPAGSVISTPYGWYDAGDYNKYIVNSGITTWTLMQAFLRNKALLSGLTWNIPESGNDVPDILDEVRWNLEWMRSMQDPDDGGVYHKNTTANFEGFVKPEAAQSKRYVTAKSTAATLDFAAVMAKASVVYADYDPAFSKSALLQAEKAWDWAIQHPNEIFKNPKESGPDGPAVNTGEYGNGQVKDEFFWAAAELYLATGDQSYADSIMIDEYGDFGVPAWPNVESLGLITLVTSDKASDELKALASAQLQKLADQQMETYNASPVHITLNSYRWGSNSDILNQGLVLIAAYDLTGNEEYLTAAASGLDYVLGRNATGYCFVTGFGDLSPMNVHHRPSASDDIAEPIPGMLAGGPNPNNMEQDCGMDQYPDHHPAMAFADIECSYSTNEVAINWNAPLVYVSASIQNSLSE